MDGDPHGVLAVTMARGSSVDDILQAVKGADPASRGAALGRDVSYAVFPSEGPWDTVVRDGVSVHFRDTDRIVHRVP